MNTENTEVPQEPEIPAESPLSSVDQEKLALMREKLKAIKASREQTISGSEAPVEEQKPTGDVMLGKDVDWSEYDLQFNVKHLYRDARFQMTEQGPKWVALIDEFLSADRAFGSHNVKVAIPGGQGKNSPQEPLNVGIYLNDMINSPEGWRLVSLLPSGGGRVGVLLQRQVPVVLPDPIPLKKETEVEIPTDPELARIEDSALAFMEKEGMAAPPAEEPIELTSLENQVLSINPPTERDPGDLGVEREGSTALADQAGAEAERALEQ